MTAPQPPLASFVSLDPWMLGAMWAAFAHVQAHYKVVGVPGWGDYPQDFNASSAQYLVSGGARLVRTVDIPEDKR